MNNRSHWQIWVDTGGTFTDCIGIDPAGQRHRTKVLSSGVLRGTWTSGDGKKRGQFRHRWGTHASIFRGYQFHLPGDEVRTVVAMNPAAGTFELDHPLPAVDLPIEFELTAREEAPILGARLLTKTPLDKPLPPCRFRLGTTRATNAVLEDKGASTLLLITAGFGDLLRIGNQQRPELFAANIPDRPAYESDVLEVRERRAADGAVLQPLEEDEILRIIQYCQKQQPQAIAISLLHAFRHPKHEEQLAAALRAAGVPVVCCSHELNPVMGYLARTQTTVLNAYLEPVLRDYLSRLSAALPAGSLQLMSSSGGLRNAAHFRPVESLLSGPAGGIVGARKLAESLGYDRLLSFDMGGTSTDTARFADDYDYRFTSQVSEWELLAPTLRIETVAAGGGSICHFRHGRLQVGPESAGASPGPACYGAGGPLTLTDINLLLGKLQPDRMSIPVQLNPAIQALDTLVAEASRAGEKSYSRTEVLRGLEEIANEKMADAIRRISVAEGFDPADYPLVAFGGAGGLHACRLAELLGMDTVILPADGGLLSAYGIGMARLERWVVRQVLRPLAESVSDLPSILQELAAEVQREMEKTGLSAAEIQVDRQLAFLRFRRQDHELEVSITHLNELKADFQKIYRQRYGHLPDRPIEVVSLRVRATQGANTEYPGESLPKTKPVLRTVNAPLDTNSQVQVAEWLKLPAGLRIKGPLVVVHPYSTAFVESGWELEVHPSGNIRLHRRNTKRDAALSGGAAVQLELFTNRFTAIAREMGALLRRTALSVNIKERLDFSCGLLDPEGFLLVNAPHIPVHLGSLGLCARLCLEACPPEPGDVLITNHPRYGGSHLPDVTLLAPVHSEAGELLGYVINRAHHAEIGGRSPGSMPPDARSLAEEGVVIPPRKIVRAGAFDRQAVEKWLTTAEYPSRNPADNLADIEAGLAALYRGREKLKELADQFGNKTLQYHMQGIRHRATMALRGALQRIGKQEWTSEERLDDGHRIRVHIRINSGHITFDFTGTSSVHPGNLNANRSIVYSVVLYVLRLLCNEEVPLNEGLLEPVSIELPRSFLHPAFPDDPAACPAVVGGNTEVSQRLVDTLLRPFALAACSQGTMNNFLFGNNRFGYYETVGGGTGAGPGFAGRSGVHQHMTNTRITDPEVLEHRYPVRLREFGLRRGSGGTGRWPGGDGIVREFEFLESVEWTLISQHRRELPYGLEGGSSGAAGKQYLIRPDGRRISLAGIDQRRLRAGDRIRMETPGGGGYGLSGEGGFDAVE